jgi:hypothetical protein
MMRPLRLTTIALITLASASWALLACSDDSNEGNQTTSKGGSSSTSSGGSSAASGGASSASSNTTTSGGATSPGSTNTDAAGGTTGTTDTTTAGGSTSTGSKTPPGGDPPNGGTVCDSTVAKNGACTTEGAVCYKSCGPTNSGGWKSETCTNAVWVEVSACTWTGANYNCYTVPATLAGMDAQCPTDATPQASQPCSVPGCVPCTDVDGNYMDSKGGVKAGWCVCNTDAATAVWTCGTTGTSWPCPGATGC